VYPVPALVWFLVLAYAVAIVVLPGVAVAKGGAPRAGLWVCLVLGAAMVASAAVAAAGGYRQESPRSFVWVGLPMVGLLVLLLAGTRLAPVRRALAHPATPARLALPQAFRLAGVVFVMLVATHDLPPDFGLPAGLGDIAVAAAGAVLAWRAYRGARDPAGLFWFNVFGLADIVVAVFFGVTSAPGLLHALHVTPTTAAMTLLPLALVPSVGVPVMVSMHVVSLHQLARHRRHKVFQSALSRAEPRARTG
jgi:hypothetical protein